MIEKSFRRLTLPSLDQTHWSLKTTYRMLEIANRVNNSRNMNEMYEIYPKGNTQVEALLKSSIRESLQNGLVVIDTRATQMVYGLEMKQQKNGSSVLHVTLTNRLNKIPDMNETKSKPLQFFNPLITCNFMTDQDHHDTDVQITIANAQRQTSYESLFISSRGPHAPHFVSITSLQKESGSHPHIQLIGNNSHFYIHTERPKR